MFFNFERLIFSAVFRLLQLPALNFSICTCACKWLQRSWSFGIWWAIVTRHVYNIIIYHLHVSKLHKTIIVMLENVYDPSSYLLLITWVPLFYTRNRQLCPTYIKITRRTIHLFVIKVLIGGNCDFSLKLHNSIVFHFDRSKKKNRLEQIFNSRRAKSI